jgi:hypothetical protein
MDPEGNELQNAFLLNVIAGKNKAIQFLDDHPNVNLEKLYVLPELKTILLEEFYPELLFYPKTFNLDSDILFHIFKTKCKFDGSMSTHIKHFVDANLLSATDTDRKLNFVKIFAQQMNSINYGNTSKEAIKKCLSLIESAGFEIDYKNLFAEILASDDASITVLEICEENGVEFATFCADFVKKNVDRICGSIGENYSLINHLTYLLNHREGFEQEIDVTQLFRAASENEDINDDFDFLCMFIKNGLVLESDDDIKSAFMWVCHKSEIHDVVDFVVKSPIYNELKHKCDTIDYIMTFEGEILNKIKALNLIGIDYVEQLRTYCQDPNFEPEFTIDYITDWEEINEVVSMPFGYQTQREFELYLTMYASKFAYSMIKNGFKPNFVTEPNFSSLENLFANYEVDVEIFIGAGLPLDMEDAIVATYNSRGPAVQISETGIYDINIMCGGRHDPCDKIYSEIRELGKHKNPDCHMFEELVRKIKHDINRVKDVLKLIFDVTQNMFFTKIHADICLDIAKAAHGDTATCAILIDVMTNTFENTKYLQLKIYQKFENNAVLFKTCLEEQNIDFITEFVLPLLNQSREKRHIRVILLIMKCSQHTTFKNFFSDCDGLIFPAIEYLLDSILNAYVQQSDFLLSTESVIAMFTVCEEFGFLRGEKYEKVLETFIYRRIFTNVIDVQNLCEKLSAHFPILDKVIIDAFKTKTTQELRLTGWFTNKYFCEHVLAIAGY